jgi:hypothetical protein
MQISCNFYQVDDAGQRINELKFKFEIDGRTAARKAFFTASWDFIKRVRMYNKVGAKVINCRLPLVFEMTKGEQVLDLGRCERVVVNRFKYGHTGKAQRRWVNRMWFTAEYMINNELEVIDHDDFQQNMLAIEATEVVEAN